VLTPEENRRLTEVGPQTPMGAVFRRYWLPALLSSELPEADGPPVRVRLLGEELVGFRDTTGSVGLLSAYCPHRRAPLFFGRNEEAGLRCVYHGWKFDRAGACVDMPSEPSDSLFKSKVGVESYPTHEAGGIVWAFMGPIEMLPSPPDFEFVRAPASHRHVSKTFESCNYLQALEGGVDTAHSSFTHNNDLGNRKALRQRDRSPRIDVERTDFGYTYSGIRDAGENDYVRVYHYIMPSMQCRGNVMGRDGEQNAIPMIDGHIWVPIDDEHTFVYNWMYAYDPATSLPAGFAVARETAHGRGPDDIGPDFRLHKNLANDYEIDRTLQKQKTFTGIVGVNTQDYALQEGMGSVVDRTKEHLGTSDRAIIVARQLLMQATNDVAAGKPPRGADPQASARVRPVDRLVPKNADWHEALKQELVARF
jgi:phthalate 4,5-dioxygenase oxygenase subunit